MASKKNDDQAAEQPGQPAPVVAPAVTALGGDEGRVLMRHREHEGVQAVVDDPSVLAHYAERGWERVDGVPVTTPVAPTPDGLGVAPMDPSIYGTYDGDDAGDKSEKAGSSATDKKES